jgi:transposase
MLIEQLAQIQTRVATLEAELAAAKKNSRNSSKPPSSDITKPLADRTAGGKGRKNPDGKKRKAGGQPGHDRHERIDVPEEELDAAFEYHAQECPHCGGEVSPADAPPRTTQQIEIVFHPVITEHREMAVWCESCQKMHYTPLPANIRRAGLCGPALMSLIAYLKGPAHNSYRMVQEFLHDVCGVSLSTGYLAKVCGRVSTALAVPYEELIEQLRQQPILNIDETGHKENGRRMWTWVFRSALFSLFRIDASRGSQVLVDVLGQEFAGVIGCDYFSAYRKYMGDFGVAVQFCLAHLIRDLKFLAEHPDARNRRYGKRVLKAVREMFSLIHHRDEYSADEFAGLLEDAGNEVFGQAITRVPSSREAGNLANRFYQHGESYLKFITTPGLDPTNNVAEQAIRFVVIDRKITQGSRSEWGRHWLERIWTVIATCRQQGRSIFDFLSKVISTWLSGTTPPTLIPALE